MGRQKDTCTVTHYRLHYFPESGNSYKLALMLTLCGETFEPVWTDFGARVTWTPEWRAEVNEMGEIPVLEMDGRKLTQTAPILLRLARKYDRFGARNEDEEYDILRWLFWDNQKLTGFMATYRYMRAFTPSPDEAELNMLRRRLKDFLTILENHFTSHAFVLGDRATIADISMCGYLLFPPVESGYDLAATHPAISRWLDRIRAIPGWQAPYDLLPGKRLKMYV